MFSKALLIVAAGFAVAAATPSQQTAPASLEVSSVRENDSNEGAIGFRPNGPGRIAATNMTIRRLVASAYGGFPDSRVLGGPGWIDSTRYDIAATSRMTNDPLTLLQTVLRERFALRVRRETREFDVYNLVRARADGRLGPGLRSSAVNCGDAQAREEARARGVLTCGAVSQRPGQITARGVSLNGIVGYLAAGRPVFERTGLTGSFDIDLAWAAAPSDDGPSVFTAVQEQLGLRLQNDKAPLEVIIIEHVERPTNN